MVWSFEKYRRGETTKEAVQVSRKRKTCPRRRGCCVLENNKQKNIPDNLQEDREEWRLRL